MVSAGTAIADWGVIGTFFYGFLMRLAGAVGLHHMIYPMFWYTPLGGTEAVAGYKEECANDDSRESRNNGNEA